MRAKLNMMRKARRNCKSAAIFRLPAILRAKYEPGESDLLHPQGLRAYEGGHPRSRHRKRTSGGSSYLRKFTQTRQGSADHIQLRQNPLAK
jgi:hypothetical protein